MSSSLVGYPVSLPNEPISEGTDAPAVAASFASELDKLGEGNFVKDALWRDHFALTGTLRTFHSASSVATAWRETSTRAKAHSFAIDAKSAQVIRIKPNTAWIQVKFTFETNAVPQTTCSGFLSLVPDDQGTWRIWVLRTLLEQLKGQPNVDKLEPLQNNGHKTNEIEESTHFECVVIGGGQAGLSTGGRMQALGISSVILDKNPKIGDSWALRYKSAKLHTVREYSHLPFDRTFSSSEWPEWLTKDDLARGYQSWVAKFGINIWQSSEVIKGTWDPVKSTWTLHIKRNGKDHSITCSYIVLAVGANSQKPVSPSYPNRELFEGTVLHSVDYRDASDWKSKSGVVVGTANTAHDVAEDMVAAGLASVTMIQRGTTYVLPVEYYKVGADMLYNSKIPIEVADRLASTAPIAVADIMIKSTQNGLAAQQPERFDALEKAGFKVQRYGSLMDSIWNKLGGHYIDIGTSKKISDGLIKMKSDSLPISYVKDGLEFSDGSKLEADVIVFATGFVHSMKGQVSDMFGPEVAEQMGEFWGLDEEGEARGAWKRCGHPALFYHGGAIGAARFYSRFIALQVKAALLGTPLPLYNGKPESSLPN